MNISPDKQKLLGDVVANGQFANEDETLAAPLRLARNNSNRTVDKRPPPGNCNWTEAFYHWSRKNRVGNPNMDDSRDSIYEAR